MKSIIVPLYFTDLAQYQVIRRCFDSLKDFDGELIVINDNSPLEVNDFPVTIKHTKNLGYTRSVNDGLRIATGDTLIVANQDVVFTPELLDKFDKINFGIYSPKTTDEGPGDKFGSIWAMSRKVYRLLGFLDERMPHFFSDLDYYTRAKEVGVPIVKWPLLIEHQGQNAYRYVDHGSFYQADMQAYKEKWGRVD